MPPNSKAKLMTATQNLLLERGFAGASVDAICDTAGVSKGSFFHHFKNKEHAAQETLTWFSNGMKQRMLAIAIDASASPSDQLFAYLDGMINLYQQPDMPAGCLLGHLALEISDVYPALRDQIEGHFDQWRNYIAKLIQNALHDDSPDRAHTLAQHFIAGLEGGLLLAKAKQDRALVLDSMHHFKSYMQHVLHVRTDSNVSNTRETLP